MMSPLAHQRVPKEPPFENVFGFEIVPDDWEEEMALVEPSGGNFTPKSSLHSNPSVSKFLK